ncbi:MAG: MpV17 mitochondrial inner membrane protein [Cyphobasidiales sp. Tagirdzhanova-0007]|nr:MAG: MpV17 mitochondrial inner membrane protein [Cyphobasidiales sp. Tagirdzhanova-0007]
MVTFMPFTTILFFGSMGLMEGLPIADIKQRWQTNFPKIIQNAYLVFVPAQLINIRLLPLYARPPFLNCIGLGWTVYLAWINSQNVRTEALQEKANMTASEMEM